MKTCRKCKVIKVLDAYSLYRAASDGRQSVCKECAKQVRKDWSFNNKVRQATNFAKNYQKNKEARDATNRNWIVNNLERRREIARLYAARNPDKLRLIGFRWRQSNLAAVRSIYAKRRAAKKLATPIWASYSDILRFYSTADSVGMLLGEWYEVDHIVPLQSPIVCGLHCEANLQILTLSENRSKSNRYWPEMPT